MTKDKNLTRIKVAMFWHFISKWFKSQHQINPNLPFIVRHFFCALWYIVQCYKDIYAYTQVIVLMSMSTNKDDNILVLDDSNFLQSYKNKHKKIYNVNEVLKYMTALQNLLWTNFRKVNRIHRTSKWFFSNVFSFILSLKYAKIFKSDMLG